MNRPCSIVLSTYNRIDYLKRCIPVLLTLNYESYEIVIVNDGSTDGTKEYLESLQDARIRYVHHVFNMGLCPSRNDGIKAAQFDIIAFTDDDCIPHPDWLFHLLHGYTDSSVGLCIGQTYYVSEQYKGYFPERLVQNRNAQWPMGCNVSYKKAVFESVGYFDKQFDRYHNDDTEMALRAISYGFSFYRASQAVVYHQSINWSYRSLMASARNASVCPVLKKKYPAYFRLFGGPCKWGFITNPEDYLYFITFPVLIPLLFLRYLMHGKRNIGMFFAKWPLYFIARRWYIYYEAAKNKVFML